jgi:hypothetical protein
LRLNPSSRISTMKIMTIMANQSLIPISLL